MRSPFPTHEDGPDLLRRYLEGQRLRRAIGVTCVGVGLALLVFLACWSAVRYRDATWIGVLAFALALIGLVAAGLAYAAGAYWLGWSYARSRVRQGATRPAALHVLTILALSGLVGLPFGGFVLWDDALWRFALVYGWVTWHTASSCFLGYVAPFWFRSSR